MECNLPFLVRCFFSRSNCNLEQSCSYLKLEFRLVSVQILSFCCVMCAFVFVTGADPSVGLSHAQLRCVCAFISEMELNCLRLSLVSFLQFRDLVLQRGHPGVASSSGGTSMISKCFCQIFILSFVSFILGAIRKFHLAAK
jgi:hypothetical protein